MLEMRNMLNKKLNKKGFTLAELLVVVAILAVLVAVSIPIFTGRLNAAKESTDAANLRAAKAAAVNAYMAAKDTDGATYAYIAKDGVVTTGAVTTIEGYNKVGTENSLAVEVVIEQTDGENDPVINATWETAKH